MRSYSSLLGQRSKTESSRELNCLDLERRELISKIFLSLEIFSFGKENVRIYCFVYIRHRIFILVSCRDAFEEKQVAESLIKAKREDVSLLITKTEDFSLPPGVSDVTMLNQLSQRVVNFISGEGNSNTNVSDSATSKGIDDSKSNNDHKVATTQATKKPLPPKPPGPPPAWAFKNNPQAVIDGKNMSKV